MRTTVGVMLWFISGAILSVVFRGKFDGLTLFFVVIASSAFIVDQVYQANKDIEK